MSIIPQFEWRIVRDYRDLFHNGVYAGSVRRHGETIWEAVCFPSGATQVLGRFEIEQEAKDAVVQWVNSQGGQTKFMF